MDMTEMMSQQLTASRERLRRCLEDVTDDEARQVLAGQLSPVTWQVGHVATIDASFVTRGGGTFTLPPRYAELFGTGTGGRADYPPLSNVWAVFDGAHQALLRVAAQAHYPTPVESRSRAFTNLGEMLIFACHHRGYHIGKITTLRALLGKPRLFG
jgi:uncharacterized damage-inducible protein DinB